MNFVDFLCKFYGATGGTSCTELMRDSVRAHSESIRAGGSTNQLLTYCDADSRGSRGGHVTGWNETNGILMAQELPGIYMQTDSDHFYVFDAIEAKIVSRNASGITLSITNPTKFDASVSIFAESAKQAKQPLGYTALLKWPKVTVKAGESRQVTVAKDGKVGVPHEIGPEKHE